MNRSNARGLAASLAAACLAGVIQAAPLDYPATPKRPVTEAYHGVAVSEDYRWLEATGAPEVKDWVAAQNQLSRAWLDAMPGREALRARLRQLMGSASNAYSGLAERGGHLFAMKFAPPAQQSLLVLLDSPDRLAGERVVLDPNRLSAKGAVTIDFFVPSLDGRRIAVSLSENGSEEGTLHVFDVASGAELDQPVPRVAYPTGGGSVAWARDGSGFYYTRYPAPGERPEADRHFFQQVWFHRLGTDPARDRYEIGREFPRIAETQLLASNDGRRTVALVANGDGGEHALYLRDARGWRELAGYEAELKQVAFDEAGALYLLSRRGAPRGQVLRLAPGETRLARAQVVLAQGEASIEQFVVGGGRIVAAEVLGGPSRLRALDLKTGAASLLPIPEASGVDDLVAVRGRLLARMHSYLQPAAWYELGAAGAPRRTALAQTSAADYADCEVLRDFAVSRDGTRVPLTIVQKKGTPRDGRNPVLLSGYGGFGVSETPRFSSSRRVWLERGGVLVMSNLRGGDEYGQAWHEAGRLTRKQNVFDDFIAVARHLVAQRITSPERLAIRGGSNGGLLMGAVLTQQPALFRAVHASVGIYDMLRVELDPNGAFNVTEFGSVKDRAQFDALLAYSPLHAVRDGSAYPAVLMTTGDNDGRVNPAHSRKMVARLQAASPTGAPILLRTSGASGHGIGTALDLAIEENTDSYGFLMHELGMSLAP